MGEPYSSLAVYFHYTRNRPPNQTKHVLPKSIKVSCYVFWKFELAPLSRNITETERKKNVIFTTDCEPNLNFAFICVLKGWFWNLFHRAIIDKWERPTVILQFPPQIEKQLMNTNQQYLDFCPGWESVQMNSPLKLNFEYGIINAGLNFRCIAETWHLFILNVIYNKPWAR